MTPTKKPYKGCRDFFPDEMRTRDFLFTQMRKTAELFAYEPYDGPLLEEITLYKAKSGEELINDQIYSFTDRGNREVAIRPEMTPTLARMVANIHKQTAKPIRWYAIPNLMRYEKPQRGRVREHWQYNVDIFGAPVNLGEIEILSLIIHFLSSFGATQEMFSILLNDRRVVDGVFNKLLKLDNESSYKLYKVIDKAKKVSSEKLNEMISEVITDEIRKNIFHKYLQLTNFEDLILFLEEHDLKDNCQDFIQFTNMIKSLDLVDYLVYDPTIVRGLDYYTGIVFEIFDKHPDNNRAIAGGGAYANLLQIFNENPLAGVGFGLGDVTLKDFLETHQLLGNFEKPSFDFALYCTDESNQLAAFELGAKLRELNIKTEIHLGQIKFNKIIKTAENKGYKKIGIIELKDGNIQVQLKDLVNRVNGDAQITKPETIVNFLNQG
ncbi:MAG: histidine--tRNA ligase [Flavobacteriaceae bacterium]|nr:histidine--tRNA ligase [Flavobacteriaceae bacterium]